MVELAEFLTNFLDFYSENLKGPVSVEDLVAADDHQQYLAKVKDLKEEIRRYKFHNPTHADHPYADQLSTAEAELGNVSARARAVDALLERFFVWSTKALAQHLMLSHEHHRESENEARCWAIMLNIPSAVYYSTVHPMVRPAKERSLSKFAQLWASIYNQGDHPCALGLPPNIDTWQEYLRLCSVVALLPNESAVVAAHCSPLSGDLSWHKSISNPKWHLNPADLVALWVRAQHSSQARRHFYQLFCVSRVAGGFQARYAGNNSRGTYAHAVKEAPLLDQLAQFCVVNQVMFTQPPLLAEWRERQRACYVERQRRLSLTRNPSDAKRLRRSETNDVDVDEDEVKEIRRAAQRHVLRTFARRSRQAVEILFFDPSTYEAYCKFQPMVGSLASRLVENGVWNDIKRDPRWTGLSDKFSDWTLAKIDRRIGLGAYDNPKGGDKKQRDRLLVTVRTLLQVLQECAVAKGFEKEPFEIARLEFRNLYKEGFLKGVKKDGIVAAARQLLQSGSKAAIANSSRLAGALLAAPAPWIGRCRSCDKPTLRDPAERLFVCACCEAVVHSRCLGQDQTRTMSCQSLVRDFGPLKSVYTLKAPPASSTMPRPDYRGDRADEVHWSSRTVTIKRAMSDDGNLPPYGLVVKTVSECADALDLLINEEYTVVSATERHPFPVAFDQEKVRGLVVSNVDDGSLGAEQGISVGDVIQGVQLIEFAVADGEEAKYQPKIYSLEKLSKEDALDVLKARATKIRIILSRPCETVAEAVADWTQRLRDSAKTLQESLKYNEALWFCNHCRAKEGGETIASAEPQVVREARQCKALLRTLAQESSSQLWLTENHAESGNLVQCEEHDAESSFIVGEHSKCVSLRRLECMMDVILSRSNRSQSSLESCVLDNAFYVGSRRLRWAPKEAESSPFQLVCDGMSLIAQSPLRPSVQGPESTEERTKLISTFLRLFCSWCLASCRLSKAPIRTNGTPRFAGAIRGLADFERYCLQCLVRSTNWGDDACDCCCELAKVVVPPPRFDEIAASYEDLSSRVGRTVLLVPTDPIIKKVNSALRASNIRIEANERPVEFLVASFLPAGLETEGDYFSPLLEGTYHLLPVISFKQLVFLRQKCCSFRQVKASDAGRSSKLSRKTIERWMTDGLLDLDGVVQMSPAELELRMDESLQIEKAVYVQFSAQLGCVCSRSLRSMRDGCHSWETGRATPSIPCSVVDCQSRACSDVRLTSLVDEVHRSSRWDLGSKLIEALVNSRSPILLEMVRSQGEHDASGTQTRSNHTGDCLSIDGESADPLVLQVERVMRRSDRESLLVLPLPSSLAADCSIFYSDLIGEPSNGKFDECLTRLDRLAGHPAKEWHSGFIILPRRSMATTTDGNSLSGVPEYKGVGWGFELVSWKHDKPALRVGRVHRNSPAARAGLRPHDALISVNGKLVEGFTSDCDFTRSMLAPQSGSACRTLDQVLATAASLEGEGKAIGPVFVRIQRLRPIRAVTPGQKAGKNVPAPVVPQVQQRTSEMGPNQIADPAHARNPSSRQQNKVLTNASPLQRREPERQVLQDEELEALFNDVNGHVAAAGQVNADACVDLTEDGPSDDEEPSAVPLATMQARHDPSPGANQLAHRQATYNHAGGMFTWNEGHVPLTVQFIAPAYERLRTTPFGVTNLSFDHLYRPCPATVLSLVESSLLLECVRRQRPMLGIRMLCPRYNVKLLVQQLNVLAEMRDLMMIPKIPTEVYNALVTDDFRRSQRETGPVCFVDDGPFSYRMPVHRLAIDRLVEALLPRPTMVHHGVDPDRLRGGGGSNTDCREEKVVASEAPREKAGCSFPLGLLPDFQQVGWLSSDPNAVYILPATAFDRSSAAQLRYQNAITKGFGLCPCAHGAYWCFWGCSIGSEEGDRRLCLSFATANELQEHLRDCHSFSTDKTHKKYGCERMSAGAQLRRLMECLAGAACAEHSSLLRLTTKLKRSNGTTERGLTFSMSPVQERVAFLQESNDFGEFHGVLPLNTYRNILRLFDAKGQSRISTGKGAVDGSQNSSDGPVDQTPETVAHSISHGNPCELCDLGTEQVLLQDSSGDSAISSSDTYRGLGCTAVSNLCFEDSADGSAGHACLAELLIATARKVPVILRVGFCGDGTTQHFGQQLWASSNFERWCDFIFGCRHVESLSRAFLVLVSSVEWSNLPNWWNNEGTGWCSAQTILAIRSPSALFLHVSVFDSAVAEFASALLFNKPDHLLTVARTDADDMDLDERVAKALKRARALGISDWDGEHNSLCAACGDGGELLCCELCPNVYHNECLSPSRASVPRFFVCKSCLLDLETHCSH